MTRLFRLIVILGLSWATVDAVAQYGSVPDEDMYRTDERRYGHLEYFGFYASAMAHWNFTEELAPFTNLTWIHVGSATDEAGAIDAMVERMLQARDAGVQAVLSIEPFLFLNQRGDLRPDEDTEDFLVDLRARLEYEGLLDTLLMIYPKDEPFREFIRYRNPSYIDQYVTGKVYKDIHKDLVHVNGLVKLVFPEKPIGVILSGYSLHHRFFSIPENYDWVGFDCYDNLFRGCDDRSFVDSYSRLLDYMQPHQRLMAVPEAWVQNEDLDRADWPDVLMRRFRQHYEMALNEPRFIAFVPFIWSFEAEGAVPGVGLDRVVELFDDSNSDSGSQFVDYVQEVGWQVKYGMLQFPNMAWSETEDTPARPPSSVRGQIMSITPRGLVSAWAFDDSLPHKNLEVRLLLRDEKGKLIYKSRPERTYVYDPDLRQGDRIGRGFIGLHGYRYQIPRDVLTRHGGQNLDLEFVIYVDGPSPEIAQRLNQEFTGDFSLSPPTASLQSSAREKRSNPTASGSASPPRSSPPR
jgi:hypothetical protein